MPKVSVSFYLSLVTAFASAEPADEALVQAEQQFELKNYKDAREKYEAFLQMAPRHDKAQHGVGQILACRLRMGEFAEALDFARSRIAQDQGTLWEARGCRRYGNLLMAVPHWGTRRAGRFLRAQRGQGEWVNSFRKDRAEALRQLEAARSLYLGFLEDAARKAALSAEDQQGLLPELLECDFDLSGAVLRRREYAQSWDWWEDFSETDEEIEDYEAGHGYRFRQVRGSQPPSGLRAGPDGKPQFTPTPAAYAAALPDDQKARYLLTEIEARDATPAKEYKALALYRRAMVARARFGPDRVVQWWQQGNRAFGPLGQPQAEDPKKPEKELWQLKENEALTWVAGELRVLALPPEEDLVALLSSIGHDYGQTEIADDALYALGAFFQSRQQYPRALEAYDKLLGKFPQTSYREVAEQARRTIRQNEVQIHQVGAQLPGSKAKLQVSYRNTDRIRFSVQPIDLPGFMARIVELEGKITPPYPQEELDGLPPHVGNMANPHSLGYFLLDPRHNRFQKLLSGQPTVWEVAVPDDGTRRPAQVVIETPIDQASCYFVEAAVEGGQQPARNLFIVTDIAILEKTISNRKLYYVADAVTGAPLPGVEFSVYETWNEGRQAGNQWQNVNHAARYPAKASDQGMFEFSLPPQPNRSRQVHALVHLAAADSGAEGPRTRFAFTGMSYWYPSDPVWQRDNQTRIFAFTDRPVYRPKDTVRFKVWIRRKQDGEYAASAGLPLHVEIFDARGNKIATHDWQAGPTGSAEGSLTLGEEPPLGAYRIQIQSENKWWGNATFRVEEYKKPEFEVTVTPAATQARLGQPIRAVIEARYYFGAPVTEARVKYKVLREAFQHQYVMPGRYDWLYGPGYGLLDYPCEWFPWWRRWGCCKVAPPWYRWTAPAPQLVQQAETEIGKDGRLEVAIETADALAHHGDTDHRYVIEAEVADSSRRTIAGSGAVSATRQSFYATVQTDRGWLQPGEQASYEIVTQTPDNTPVAVKGKVTVSEVRYRGQRNDEIIEDLVQTFDVETDASGRALLPLRFERSGQFRVAFRAQDAWGGEVQGNALTWVAGNTFDGGLYRFNSLEILTDKREYEVGQVAHVLLNVAEPDSYVLFSSDAYSGVLRNYQLLHLPSRSRVVDVPIERRHEPSFFIEATVVRNGQVHQMARELPVPTARYFLSIQAQPEKPGYAPGGSGSLLIQVKDYTGKPAAAELALAVFDRSILYIQPETTPKIEAFFHGQKPYHQAQSVHSFQWFFQGLGGVSNPFSAGIARDWWGYWNPEGTAWQEISGQMFLQLGAENRQASRDGRARRKEAEAPMGLAVAADALQANAMGEGKMDLAKAAGVEEEKQRADRGVADKAGGGAGAPGGDAFAEAAVRANFADTALWTPSVPTDAEGKVTVPISFPDSLTSWKINVWGMSESTQVGQASASTVTTKNLLVRLQSPRFFVERDEVVLSANIHNDLAAGKRVKAELLLPDTLLSPETPLSVTLDVPARGEKRVDWNVRVLREGLASITVKALTDEESDAMRLAFPVFVHGIEKQVAQVGCIPPGEETATREYRFTIPEERNPEATRLVVKVAPTLAGAVLDALPYLFAYEYDTVESTLSRFLPAVVTRRMLRETGLNLEAIEEKRRDLPMSAPERLHGYWTNPVFDSKELNRIVNTCLGRVLSWQQPSGGWGWWGSSSASVYQTCYVLYCLSIARKAGIEIAGPVVDRGMDYVQNNLEIEMGKFEDGFHTGHAYACFVLSLSGRRNDAWLNTLFDKRDRLNHYGKALLCLAYHQAGNAERAGILLQNIEQHVVEDAENETAWLKTDTAGWWSWWNNDVETNAWLLQCYSALQPKAERPRRLVKWLLNNRRHGHYWYSTRDTAITVNAFAEFIQASGEMQPDYELTVSVDNGVLGRKSFSVNPRTMFFFDNLFQVSGEGMGPGEHTVQVMKKGPGAAYLSVIATFFSREEDIQGAGLELKVDRRYYRLVPKTQSVDVTTTSGGKAAEKFGRYERVPLKTGEALASGDLLEIELLLQSKNDYDYLVFEDMKPAGCEPVELRSGGSYQEGLVANMELRDEKVAFFIPLLHQGEHRLRYRLRAEIPGHFHALPTRGFGMYAPDLYGTSDEMRLQVRDQERP